MRKFFLLTLVLLVLTACATTPEPNPSAPSEAQPTAPQAASRLGEIPAATPPPQAPASTAPAAPSAVPVVPATAGPTTLSLPSFLSEFNLGIPAGNSYIPRSLVVHSGLGRIYARTRSQSDEGQVTVLDAASGQVLAIVPTGPDPYAEGELALDAERNRLYATNPDDVTCSILDAASLEIVGTIQGVDRLAVDEATGRLYAAGLGGLRLFAAADDAPLAEVVIGYAPRFWALAVHPGQGRVYAVYSEQRLFRLDAYDATSLEMRYSVSLPGQPDGLAADPHRDRMYVTVDDGEKTRLWTLDGSGRLVDDRELGSWTQESPLALDPEGDRLFVGRDVYHDQAVDVLDLGTDRHLAEIPLRYAPNTLAWDRATGRLLIGHTYANLIAAADPGSGQVTGLFATALDLVDLAVDPEAGYLYATDSAGRLHVLDGESGQELALLPGEGRISVDSQHGRVYTGGQGADRVRIFERATAAGQAPLQQTGEIDTSARPVADPFHDSLYLAGRGIYPASLDTLTITGVISDTLPDPAGFSPNPTAVDALVDPQSGRILAMVNNGVPGSNNGNYLYVYEPDSQRRILTDTERSLAWLDVDPTTGRAYVSRTRMGQGSTSLLADGRKYVARLDALAGPLRVDPGLGRLYLSKVGYLGLDGTGEDGQLVLLDAGNLDILGSVPIPAGFHLLDLDPQRHLLYLGSRGGRVQIWSAAGGQRAAAAEPQVATLPLDEVWAFYPAPAGSPIFAASLYRSDDEGQTWQRLGGGLPRQGVAQVVLSPDFDRDGTLFAVLVAGGESLGIWKSTDGGGTWRMANAGLSDLAVQDLAISPDFGRDGTLLATTSRQGLFRSTDGGENWQRLTERYYQAQDYYVEPPGDVWISPTYAHDRTLFVAHIGLWRSTDGGETWQSVFASGPSSLALSPDFAGDGTLYGWFGGSGLLRSTDGGETWQPASRGLYVDGPGNGRLLRASRAASQPYLYLHWQPNPPGQPDQYFRSADGGERWEVLAGDLPAAASQVRLSADGSAFLALDGEGRLARWPVDELDWLPAGLPPLADIDVYRLTLSPTFARDQVLYAVSPTDGILRSGDGGLTWTDTGFPLRTIYTEPTALLATPSGTVWAGSEVGLYRAEEGTSWQRVGGGLPQGVAVTAPELGADGSLRVLAGESQAERQVYLSLDGGQTWTQPVPRLPHASLAEEVLFSPAFASDRFAILATSWQAPQRTVGGGPWQAFGPPGEWLLSALEMSPAFDRDGLLLLRLQDNGFWRSSDGGQTWQEIDVPWGDEAPRGLDAGASFRLSAATFSPDYGRDGVLLVRAGNRLYRSTDAGATWQGVLDLGPTLVRSVFSPGYADDGLIYLLQANSVYRSADRGNSWQRLPTVPWAEFDDMWFQISPTFPRDNTLLAWNMQGQVYLSANGGQAWQEATTGLDVPGLRQVHFSPDYAGDGLLYAVPHGGGLYKWTGNGRWLPVTQRAPERAATPSATPPPPPAPTQPVPPPTLPAPPTPACPTEPERFGAVWQQASDRLGCPVQPAAQVQLAEQRFEQGSMIWDADQQQIHVLLDAGTWQVFADTWDPNTDPAYDPELPPPPRQPQRGFGKVWRQQLGGPEAAIGWAVEDERPVAGWQQRFERGLLFWTDATVPGAANPGTAYLLYDDGTWQAFSAP